MSTATKVAIIGSGNIGTDLMIKVNRSEHLEMGGQEDMIVDIPLTLVAQKQTQSA